MTIDRCVLTPAANGALAQAGHRDNTLSELLLELGNAHHALGEKIKLCRDGEMAFMEQRTKSAFHRPQHCPSAVRGQTVRRGSTDMQRPRVSISKQRKLVYAQGVIARGSGELDHAAQLLRRLSRNPAYPICLNTYGLLLRDIGRTHRARHCFESFETRPRLGAAVTISVSAERRGSLRRGLGMAARQKL